MVSEGDGFGGVGVEDLEVLVVAVAEVQLQVFWVDVELSGEVVEHAVGFAQVAGFVAPEVSDLDHGG